MTLCSVNPLSKYATDSRSIASKMLYIAKTFIFSFAMMEALTNYNTLHKDEDFYRSQAKTRELDVLWQSFGVKSHKNEKAPQVYFVTGFVIGVIVTLAITTIVSLLINITTPKNEVISPVKKSSQVIESNGKFSFIPADTTSTKVSMPTTLNEEYVVKEGDTLESIVIRFYGSFDMNKVNAIQSTNKMANPNALVVATSAMQAVHMVGMPEARIILAEAAIYVATSPKSNAAYMAINNALEDVKNKDTGEVPMHIRNAPAEGMQQFGYHEGYKYPHDYSGHFVEQQYLPDKMVGTKYYIKDDTIKD